MVYHSKVVSFDRSPNYIHHRAMLNRRENHAVDALELMRSAVENAPENREYKLDLAEMYCEMGCHAQSSKLLLDMLSQEGAPSECYYGLALNQLGMNDVEGAKRSLHMYRQMDPRGPHSYEAGRLSAELHIYDAMNHPVDRRLGRAMRIADRACDALCEEDLERAKRLFERSFAMASEQYEMRALYAMTLMQMGDSDGALKQVQSVLEGFPPSLRGLCIAAQVLNGLGETERAAKILRSVMNEHPIGAELRLLIFTLGELGLHPEAGECARLALQETPYDRQLLHVCAISQLYRGIPPMRAKRFWMRILRIDPNDSIATYYVDAADRGELANLSLGYEYQVPDEECERRFQWLSERVNLGLTVVREIWQKDAEFRKLIRWAAISSDDRKLRHVAVTVLAAMPDEEARSDVRSLLFSNTTQPEEKLHAAALLKLQGVDMRTAMPMETDDAAALMPDADQLLEPLLVGERQLLRYSADVLEQDYGISALQTLTIMWVTYRTNRGLRMDAIMNSEAASAALVYIYLIEHGKRVTLETVAAKFRCSVRRLVYYASRIADILDEDKGEKE